MSSGLFARWSTRVILSPLLRLASPIALADLWARSHTSFPSSAKMESSAPTMSAMRFQTLASGLVWCVAATVPAGTVVLMAMQSERDEGHRSRITRWAHTSAAAAVEHHVGGHPSQKANRSPSLETKYERDAKANDFQRLPLVVHGTVTVPDEIVACCLEAA